MINEPLGYYKMKVPPLMRYEYKFKVEFYNKKV
jgi:hypothetical protein